MSDPPAEGRVLVVDDETNITELVAMALRYVGFEVATAASGRDALAAVNEFRPDLVVLDVMMPDLDGFELCGRLRADAIRVPVVYLTARDATEDKVRGLTIGGDDYVTKPFSLEELIARIRGVLRRGGHGGGAGGGDPGHKAVQPRGADRPDPGRAPACRPRRGVGGASPVRGPGDGRGHARGLARGGAGRAHPR